MPPFPVTHIMQTQWLRGLLALAVLALAAELDRAGAAELTDASVKAFLGAHCTRCHGAEEQEGDLTLHDIGSDFAKVEVGERWQKVLEQLGRGEMPPADEPQPDAKQRDAVIRWIEGTLEKAGHTSDLALKMRRPDHGNYVDHRRLFGDPGVEPLASPKRLWLYTPAQYFQYLSSRLGVNARTHQLGQPFGLPGGHGFQNYASQGLISDLSLSSLLRNTEQLAARNTVGAHNFLIVRPPRFSPDAFGQAVRDRGAPEFTAFLKNGADTTLEQAKALILRMQAMTLEEMKLGNQPLTKDGLTQRAQKLITLTRHPKGAQEALRHMGVIIANGIERPAPVVPVDKRPVPEFEAVMKAGERATEVQLAAAINKAFANVLHRSPTEDELQRFLPFLKKNIKDGGPGPGMAVTLQAVMVMPTAVFRTELGGGEAIHGGRQMLSPDELAKAIQYAFTDQAPSAQGLLALPEKGELSTREDVERQVRSRLAQPMDKTPRILNFFHEFFQYHQATETFKDEKDFKHHQAKLLVRDTDMLVEYVYDADKDVLRELLTTRKAYVAMGGWGKQTMHPKQAEGAVKGFLAQPPTGHKAHQEREDYKANARARGINPIPQNHPVLRNYVEGWSFSPETWSWPTTQPFDLPAEQRAGILTHPSWLVAHSLNKDNHIVTRGKWIREKLLGGTVPNVPPTVDAKVPEDPHRTLRDRMQITRDAYCWKCHQKMDELGLAFEMYDHFGRYRTEELGGPVDTRGAIELSGDPSLDGPVANALELMRKLGDSPLVRQNFIRHAFRYWMGRNETIEDAATLQMLDKVYVDSGGSMKELIAAILTSDAFLYRK